MTVSNIGARWAGGKLEYYNKVTGAVIGGGSEASGMAENTIALLGDSITVAHNVLNTSGLGYHISDRGWFNWANAFLGQAFDVIKNAGVSGQRTDQMLSRIDADVIAYSPAWCFLLAGINDLIQDKTADIAFANLQAMYERLIDSNIRVIAATVTPTASLDSTARKNEYYLLNRKIKAYARSHPGIILIDIASVIANTADTTAVAGSTVADGLHLSANGACRIGEVIATELRKHIPYVPSTLSNSKGDASNLLGNGVMYGTAGTATTGATGTVADNWILISSGATVVGSKVARTDGIGGEMQRVTISAGGTTGFSQLYLEILTGFAVGDTIQAQLEMLVDPSSVVTERIDALIEFRNASNTVIDSIGLLFHESSNPNLARVPSGVMILKSQPYAIPATATKVRLVSKAVMTSGIIDYGRAEIVKIP